MICAGTIGREDICSFRVPEGGKITSAANSQFFESASLPWLNDVLFSKICELNFQDHDNQSHSAKATQVFLLSIWA